MYRVLLGRVESKGCLVSVGHKVLVDLPDRIQVLYRQCYRPVVSVLDINAHITCFRC